MRHKVQKTEVLESTLANRLSGLTRLVPGVIKDTLGSIADSGFPSGAALELIKYVIIHCSCRHPLFSNTTLPTLCV